MNILNIYKPIFLAPTALSDGGKENQLKCNTTNFVCPQLLQLP